MTYERSYSRWRWPGRLITSLFLVGVGGLANQFWNIPVQQQRQDDAIMAIEKHMEYNDQRLDEFKRQHEIMERQLEDLKVMHIAIMNKPKGSKR